ncbi:MAG TPA: sugar ABC transporter substrate-binding protein, partial [Candidatus Scatomorpha merdavium]|nr:sugar ABC transporter substrate-binding protein [Candidatus Scatomorpha merdavium]
AADYEQVILRNQMLGITPARADAAATIGETDATVAAVFDRLENGNVDIMPAINAVSQLWTPSESFFVELATDALSGNRGEPTKYDTIDKIQAGLENVCSQIYDGIFTLS